MVFMMFHNFSVTWFFLFIGFNLSLLHLLLMSRLTLFLVTDDVCLGLFATAANILLTANGDVKVSFSLIMVSISE